MYSIYMMTIDHNSLLDCEKRALYTCPFADVGCPPSFVRYHGRCYRAVPGVVTFLTDALQNICTRMSWSETSYLAKTDSLEVLNFIRSITLWVNILKLLLNGLSKCILKCKVKAHFRTCLRKQICFLHPQPFCTVPNIFLLSVFPRILHVMSLKI